MQIKTYKLAEVEQANTFLKENELDIKDVQFIDDNIIITYNSFDIKKHAQDAIKDSTRALEKKKLDLAVLKSYTHFEGKEVNPVTSAIEKAEEEIITLTSKINACEEWIAKNS